MADAMMMFLGEAHGVNWYWAQPGEFENPGVYYWDGVKNVLCVPHLAAAPEAPAQGDPLEKLTRIQEELGLYNDKPAVVQVPPIPLNIIRKWPDGFEARLQHVWKDVISFIPNVKLWDLQRVLAEFGFRMEVYDQTSAPEAPATAVVQVPQECPACKGNGDYEKALSSTNYTWVKCADCGGTGKLAAPEAPATADEWLPLTPEEQNRLDELLKHTRWLMQSMPAMDGLQHSWALNARDAMQRMHDWLKVYLPPAMPSTTARARDKT